MSKITMAAAAVAGYVFGTRAGRERYEQISEKATSLWNHPKVQEGAELAQEKAPVLKDKVAGKLGKGGDSKGQDDLGFGDAGQDVWTADAGGEEALTQDGYVEGEPRV